jgi:hypothetical protein
VRPAYHRLARVTPRWQLLAGTAAFLVLRLALTIPRTGPVVVADEVGYLTNARLLSGGVPGEMSTAPFYHGGYSLLIAPLLAIDSNPGSGYHLVLVLNVLLAASLAPLVYLLLTRRFSVPPHSAVWPALAAGAYPSVTIFTQVAMSENLVLPLFVAWLVCLGGFLQAATERRRLVWAASTSASAVWLWAAHGTMIVAVALTVAAFALVAVVRRETRSAALVGLVIVAVGLVAVHMLDDFIVRRNYSGHARGEVGHRLATLDSVGGIGAFLRNLVGQAWYLMVAPLGVLLAAASRPRLPRRLSSEGVLVGALALAGLVLVVETALSFRTTDRPDMLVYGRYSEVVVPPLLALALVRIQRGRLQAATAAVVIGVATVATALLRAGVHPPGGVNRWNVVSLPAPTYDLGPVVLLVAGVVAAVVVAALAVVRGRSAAAVAPLVLVLFLPTTAVTEHSPVLTAESAFYPSGWTSPARAAAGARTIAFDIGGGGELWADQWFASGSRFVLFSGSSQPPPARWVLSSPAWAAAHPRLRPQSLWRDVGRGSELFHLGAS